MKGGELCEVYVEKIGDDNYELGEKMFINLYKDLNNPNVLIKTIFNKNEYSLAKLLEHTGFVPKVYGYFECKFITKIPKYTIQQERIKAYNKFHPNDQQELGEIKYQDKESFEKYMVMEKIDGTTLIDTNTDTIIQHIDEIYRLYNILCDKGFILDDLFARNIIVSNTGKIYFIDFDPNFTFNTLRSFPLARRYTKEKLLKRILKDATEEKWLVKKEIFKGGRKSKKVKRQSTKRQSTKRQSTKRQSTKRQK
jgi:hypothetical protein